MSTVSMIQTTDARRAVRLHVNLDIHSRDAVFGAAYTFIDRCYVWLDKEPDGRLVVELTPREGSSVSPDALAGDFGNELLAQSTRAAVFNANQALVQAIVSRALTGAGAGRATADSAQLPALEAFDVADEPFDDPLGIAISWEQKYGKAAPEK